MSNERGEKDMKYRYASGKIVTREELREIFNRCNPCYCHDDIEFEISLCCDLANGTLKEVEDD